MQLPREAGIGLVMKHENLTKTMCAYLIPVNPCVQSVVCILSYVLY